MGEIAGELVKINLIVPPGAGPENFEPGPQEIRALSNSTLLIHINLFDVEKQLLSRMKTAGNAIQMLDISNGIKLIKEGDGHSHGCDPHIWSSVKNASILAENIEKGLSRQFPQHSDKFRENLGRLIKKLDDLDESLKAKFSSTKKKSFIIFHPALTYMANDYALNQYSLEEEGKAPSVLHMKELLDFAIKEHIKTVFLQSQFDKNNIEAFAREINGKITTIDPLSGDWLQNMEYMTDQIAISLNE